MTFEQATEAAQISDDDNRRGEPTQGLVPETDILDIPGDAYDPDMMEDAGDSWYVNLYDLLD